MKFIEMILSPKFVHCWLTYTVKCGGQSTKAPNGMTLKLSAQPSDCSKSHAGSSSKLFKSPFQVDFRLNENIFRWHIVFKHGLLQRDVKTAATLIFVLNDCKSVNNFNACSLRNLCRIFTIHTEPHSHAPRTAMLKTINTTQLMVDEITIGRTAKHYTLNK